MSIVLKEKLSQRITFLVTFFIELHFRDIKIKSRAEFEEDFDGIKELIAAKTLFMVDDKISMFEEVRMIMVMMFVIMLKMMLMTMIRSAF